MAASLCEAAISSSVLLPRDILLFMKVASIIVGVGFLILIAGWYTTSRGVPADLQNVPHLINNQNSTMESLITLNSSAFENGGAIPSKYTCDGEQKNPPLSIAAAPANTKSFALIVDDPDVPKQLKPDGMFVHWVLFNIPPTTISIGEGERVGTAGQNGAGKNQYTGPCPPAQYEPSTHRYFFKIYALDTMLPLQMGAQRRRWKMR